MEDISKIQRDIHYAFHQVKHLEIALTHSSFANEAGDHREHNERYEFLGDAVLELCVTQHLFKCFPDAREGELTKLRARLVSKPALAERAQELGLHEHLLLGKGEESQGGRSRHSLLSNTFEALLGAIYLDGGFSAAKCWVEEVFAAHWPQESLLRQQKDYKSQLQEKTQQLFKIRPVYTLVGSSGPEHEKVFEVRLSICNGLQVTACGGSVKKAEQKAAGLALKALEQHAPALDNNGD